jgi:hypothetical protein
LRARSHRRRNHRNREVSRPVLYVRRQRATSSEPLFANISDFDDVHRKRRFSCPFVPSPIKCAIIPGPLSKHRGFFPESAHTNPTFLLQGFDRKYHWTRAVKTTDSALQLPHVSGVRTLEMSGTSTSFRRELPRRLRDQRPTRLSSTTFCCCENSSTALSGAITMSKTSAVSRCLRIAGAVAQVMLASPPRPVRYRRLPPRRVRVRWSGALMYTADVPGSCSVLANYSG